MEWYPTGCYFSRFFLGEEQAQLYAPDQGRTVGEASQELALIACVGLGWVLLRSKNA